MEKFILDDLLKTQNDGLIEKKPFFNEGDWWVQNISSTLPVKLISKYLMILINQKYQF